MLKRTERYSPGLKKLWRRNFLLYVSTNLFFNSIIPYTQFEDPSAVYLFRGETCLARFLLPMALILPFIITADILKKTIELTEKEDTGILLPEPFAKYRFIFKTAAVNALVASIPILLLMLCLPAGIPYDGKISSILTGLLAAFLAAFFTFQPIGKLVKLRG